MKKPRIENWKIEKTKQSHCLIGEVFDHPKVPDGMTVKTSKILRIDFCEMAAQTLNTDYSLGTEATTR